MLGSLLAHCFRGSMASMPIIFIAVAYIFSAFGKVLISNSSLQCIGAFCGANILLLGITVFIFKKIDIN